MLRIGGITRLSAGDYPEKLAAVLYCQGCAWRCHYCHNRHLLEKRSAHEIPWADVVSFLKKRQGLLDAVVFSGGEPTLHDSLARAMQEVKALGYLVGLHTAGIVPERLQEVLPLVDWVSMDLKAPWETHSSVTGVPESAKRAKRSLELLLASGVPCEFHTVVAVPGETRTQTHDLADDEQRRRLQLFA